MVLHQITHSITIHHIVHTKEMLFRFYLNKYGQLLSVPPFKLKICVYLYNILFVSKTEVTHSIIYNIQHIRRKFWNTFLEKVWGYVYISKWAGQWRWQILRLIDLLGNTTYLYLSKDESEGLRWLKIKYQYCRGR